MNIFNFFTRRKRHPDAISEIYLAVLYATATEGLSVEDGFALRDIINAAKPIDFGFLNPGSFEVFFYGTSDGQQQAQQLADALSVYAHQRGIMPLGTGIAIGDCIGSLNPEGGFNLHPVGETISRAMTSAHKAEKHMR